MNISKPVVTTMSSREFNQDTARAKRLALNGPVFITDRGKPSHVLLTVAAFERLETSDSSPARPEKRRSLSEALAQKEGGDFDFEFPEFKGIWSLKIPELE